MHDIQTSGSFSVAAVRAGVLTLVEDQGADVRSSFAELMSLLSQAAVDCGAIAVLVDLRGCGAVRDFAELRNAVTAQARPLEDWRPWAMVVRREVFEQAQAVARHLAAGGIVTGVFIHFDLAEDYLRREGALWAARRRWNVRGTPPAAAPDQAARRQSGVRRLK